MDLKSVNKIANFNYKNNFIKNIEKNNNEVNYLKKTSNSILSTESSRLNSILKQFNNFNEFRFNKLLSYSNFISSINDKNKNKVIILNEQ
jgi:hypothetical protein